MSRGTATDPQALRSVFDAAREAGEPPILAAWRSFAALLLYPPPEAEEADEIEWDEDGYAAFTDADGFNQRPVICLSDDGRGVLVLDLGSAVLTSTQAQAVAARLLSTAAAAAGAVAVPADRPAEEPVWFQGEAVERAAEAIAVAICPDTPNVWQYLDADDRAEYRGFAAAALRAALGDPS